MKQNKKKKPIIAAQSRNALTAGNLRIPIGIQSYILADFQQK